MSTMSRFAAGVVAAVAAAGSAAAWAAPARAELRAGAAKADLTPPLGGHLYGYGARGESVSTGVHDRLWAKVLVLGTGVEEVAIVTLDLGAFEKDRVRRVKAAAQREIGLENVLLIASHTHSAPVYEKDFPSPERPYHLEAETKILEAIARARAAMRPATLAVGWGRVEEGHNRREVLPDGTVRMRWENRARVPTSPVDHAVGVIAIDGADGAPIATLVNFACHPVVLGPENLEISADYPGAMMARVEAEVGGQAMFVQGAAGDINPFWDKTPPAEGGFEQMQKMGETLAVEVVRVRQSLPSPSPVERLAIATETIQLGPRWALDDPEVEAAFRRNEFGWIFERYRERFPLERDAEISVVVFDDRLAIGAFPGEFFVEHGQRFKQQSMVRDTIFAGYANGALGYFPTIRAAAEGGYGGNEATIVEVGAGEKLVSRALVHLHTLLGRLPAVPVF